MDVHKVFVFLAGCIINGLAFGYFYSLGALFPVIMDTFNASRAETSVIQSIYTGIVLGGGIVYGAITSRFGPMKSAIVGSFTMSLGLIVSFWTTTLLYMMGTSVVIACGIGLCFVTCTVGIRQHFSGKANVTALALISSSSGVAAVVLTNLLRYLSWNFGIRGTMLIIGGIQLNSVALAVLLSSPVQRHIPKPDPEPGITTSGKASNVISRRSLKHLKVEDVNYVNKVCAIRDDTNTASLENDKRDESAIGVCNVANDVKCDGTIADNSMRGKTIHDDNEIETNNLHYGTTTVASNNVSNVSNSNNTETNSSNVNKTVTTTNTSNNLSTKAKLKHILQSPSYICTMLAFSMSISTMQMYNIFMIDMFNDKGFSEQDGATGLIILNTVAIFGRASPAAFAHCPFYDPFAVPFVATFLSSVSMVLFVVAMNLTVYFMSCAIIGFGLGVCLSVAVMSVSEILEQQYLPEAIGLIMTVNGAFGFITGLFTGYLRDVTGSYTSSQITSASCALLGSFGFVFASIFNRRQARKKRIRHSSVFYVTRL